MKYIFIIIFIYVNLLFAQMWQTTQGGYSSMWCNIDSLKIRVIVHPLSIDIEEEAVITTTGWLHNGGDANSLEIFGTFTMPTNRLIRSFILWENNHILKAKLQDKNVAKQEYEKVIRRFQDTLIFPRDPAIITYEKDSAGQATYSYAIYPVELNKGRKIRILHTMSHLGPGRVQTAQGDTDIISFKVGSIFASEYYLENDFVPVTICVDSLFNLKYSFIRSEDGGIIKSDSTYLMHKGSIIFGTAPELKIDKIHGSFGIYNKAESENSIDYYYGIYLAIPDTLLTLLKTTNYKNITVEIPLYNKVYKIRCSGKSCTSGNCDAVWHQGLSKFFKLKKPWDHKITWSLFNDDGSDTLIKIEKELPIVDNYYSNEIPLLWASESRWNLESDQLFPDSTDEYTNNGTHMRFLDKNLSLLALEKDTLPDDLAAKYRISGVPLLTANDVVGPDSIIYIVDPNTYASTKKSTTTDKCKGVSIRAIGNRQIALISNKQFPKELSIYLFSLNGKMIYKQCNFKIIGNKMILKLPTNLTGIYMLVITHGNDKFQYNILL